MAKYHLRARDIMQTEIASILPDLSVQDAASLMRHSGVRSLIVEKDTEDDAYGIVTFADIVNKVLAYGFEPSEVTVAEVMSKPLVVVNPSLKLDLIARLFAKHNIGHAPVFDNHKLVGVVSMTDLIVEGIPDPVDAVVALPARRMRGLPAPKLASPPKPERRASKAKSRAKAKARHPQS
jgi:CBS domain-containing protein